MTTHTQTPHNPYNYEALTARVNQLVTDGMSPKDAQLEGTRNMMDWQKAGIDPKHGMQAWENDNTYTAGDGNQAAAAWQAKEDAAYAAQHEANLINPNGQSFGEFLGQEPFIEQARQDEIQKIRNAQNSEFGKWMVQDHLKTVATKEAQDKEMGRRYGEAILGNRMNELRNLKVVDQPNTTKPTYTGR